VTGAVLGVGLIGLGTISVMAQFATRVAHESFSVSDPVKALTVDVGAGDVQIVADPKATSVQVDVTTRSAFRKAGYTRSVKDGTLDLNGRCGTSWMELDNCSVDFRMFVPPDVTVSVHSSSGDQSVQGVTQAVTLRAGSGDIHVSGLVGGLSARTGSGDIGGKRLASSQADLQAGSGDIRAEFSGAIRALTARTGSGDVHAGFQVPPATVAVKAGSGDVRVSVPDDGTHYDVSGSTGSGDRTIKVPTGSSTHRIEANTGSGDVTINFP
jgi:hypothetical protein